VDAAPVTPTGQPLRPATLAVRLLVYVFLYIITVIIAGPIFGWIGEYLLGITVTGLAAALLANQLSVGIFEALHLPDIGLRQGRASAINLGLGLAGGIGCAALVLAPPLAFGAAHFKPIVNPETGPATLIFTAVVLFCGAAGEELLFRGYGFQILLRSLGPYATILPVGVIFGSLHARNPSASYLGLVNTAGFGILFGYAFLRSHDLWLPIGLHFGWNVTLPLFGVNVSGLKIGVTGYVLEWTAGSLWSGGDYGPEASILTSAMMAVLFLYLRKAPVRTQASPLLDPPAGEVPCVPGPQQ
jgi:membrane protease YdiL (CAAX protease family)